MNNSFKQRKLMEENRKNSYLRDGQSIETPDTCMCKLHRKGLLVVTRSNSWWNDRDKTEEFLLRTRR